MKFHLTTICYCLFISMLLLQMNHVEAKKKKKPNLKKYMCDICSAIINEAEHMISQVDPKKTVQVGSFRISPDGKTRTVTKKFSRSESHIEDLIQDKVCNDIKENYSEYKDKSGLQRLQRMVTYDGKMNPDLDFAALQAGTEEHNKKGGGPQDTTKQISFKCSEMIESFEDDLKEYLQNDDGDKMSAAEFCAEQSYCPKVAKSKEEL